jgi:hypothetical protein
LLVFAVDREPSVIESPNATTVATGAAAATSTRARRNHDAVVAITGIAGMAVWLPVADT